MLFSKLLSSSQLLKPQDVPRACSLPELLSFATTVISKTSHHSAWGTWEMKTPPSVRPACLRLTVVLFFSPSKCFLGICSKDIMFHG